MMLIKPLLLLLAVATCLICAMPPIGRRERLIVDSLVRPSVVSTRAVQNPGTGKRGIAYNDPRFTFMFNGPKISWAYNWHSAPVEGDISSRFMYVPMLWGSTPELVNVWSNNVELALKKGGTAALGFNEPDGCWGGGSCVTNAGEAARIFKTNTAGFEGRIRLGAPAVTSGVGENVGTDWLQRFLGACRDLGCRIDFVQAHWYGLCDDLAGFQRHLQAMREAGGGRPIWVTEFGCNLGDMTQDLPARAEFLRKAMAWLDGQGWIERYAFFMARPGDGMINAAGTGLGQLGHIYNS